MMIANSFYTLVLLQSEQINKRMQATRNKYLIGLDEVDNKINY